MLPIAAAQESLHLDSLTGRENKADSDPREHLESVVQDVLAGPNNVRYRPSEIVEEHEGVATGGQHPSLTMESGSSPEFFR